MNNSYWFYHKYGDSELQRVLLLQKSKDKSDAKPNDIRKSYRSLGVTACSSLQAKKVTDVEFLVSSKVADKDLLGIFENSFYLSNYENNLKRPYQPDEEDDKKEKDEDEDPRSKRITKRVENYSITTEDPSLICNETVNFERVSAHATETARNLANTRGSIATPCYMEQAMHDIVKGHDKVKEVRVL